jgi:hypothetical protein
MLRGSICATVMLTVLAATPLAVWGQPGADARAQARELAREGVFLLEEGRADVAVAKLEAAEKLFHAPTNVLYLARARRALGQHLEAHALYVEVLAEEVPSYAPEAFHKARRTAEAEAAELRAGLAAVSLRIREAPSEGTLVRLDGWQVPARALAHPIAVAPGAHRVDVEARGRVPASMTFVGIAGRLESLEIVLVGTPAATPAGPAAPAPAAEDASPSAALVAGATALGVGGAALVAGVITGAVTLSKAADIKERCQGQRCPVEEQDAAEEAKRFGDASTWLLVVGGAGVATGVVLLVLHATTDRGERETLGVGLSPTGLHVRKRF